MCKGAAWVSCVVGLGRLEPEVDMELTIMSLAGFRLPYPFRIQ